MFANQQINKITFNSKPIYQILIDKKPSKTFKMMWKELPKMPTVDFGFILFNNPVQFKIVIVRQVK